MSFLSFSLFWFLVVPPAAARIAKTIAEERIFEALRAYVEARFPGTLLDYVIGCPVCQSYWIVLAFALVGCGLEWPAVRGVDDPLAWFVAIAYWMAAVEFTIQFWLRHD